MDKSDSPIPGLHPEPGVGRSDLASQMDDPAGPSPTPAEEGLDSELVAILNKRQEAIRCRQTKDTHYKALRDALKASQASSDNEATMANVPEEIPEEAEYQRNLETTVSEFIQVLKGGGVCT